MTIAEFSDGFDTLVDSYKRFKAFDHKEELDSLDFNEYEKSFFLTKAQEEIVISLYSGKNAIGDTFEGTEELRRYLSNLVKEVSLTPITTSNGFPLGVESSSKFFTLPENLWYITYEAATISSDDCHNGSIIDVQPVTQDEYHKLKRNPFRGANYRRALRLDLSDNIVEIVSKYTVTAYYTRYLERPNPIILIDLPDELSIYGETKTSNCKLHEALHHRILERAVALGVESRFMGASNKEK